MKKTISILAFSAMLFSCKKDANNNGTPVDNGPLGGTYSFTASVEKTYDSIPGSGILTTNEYTTTTTNLKGTVTFTATTISANGLMCDFNTTGIHKEKNTNTGATITTNTTPLTGTIGSSTATKSCNYTFSIPGSEMSIDDAQYVFFPSFLILPASKKYTYTLTGNILKVKIESYSASSQYRTVVESTFTKQ